MKKCLIPLLSALFVAGTVWAAPKPQGEWSPFQFGVGGPNMQLAPAENSIAPLRLNFAFSENDTVYGLDFGLAGKANRTAAFQFNLFNFIEGEGAGAVLAIYHTADAYTGVTFAPFNYVDGEYKGIQMGFFPKADTLYGIQFGAINRVRVLHGIQAGLVNVAEDSSVPFLPLLRIGF